MSFFFFINDKRKFHVKSLVQTFYDFLRERKEIGNQIIRRETRTIFSTFYSS